MGLPFGSFLGRFTANTASEALGFGVGVALAEVLKPEATELGQDAWHGNPTRALSAGEAAQIVAKRIKDLGWGKDEAARSGTDGDRFEALVGLALSAPDLPQALTLRRRRLITDAELEHALAKAHVEPAYWPAIKETTGTLLSAAEVAAAIQQGHLPNMGVLPNVSPAVEPAGGASDPDTPDGQPPSHVPLTEIDLDPLEQAAGSGTSLDQLKVLANLAGLPPGSETLLAMWNRGLIDEATVDAGIREGHLKTKWVGAFKRMRWAVLSAPEYANLHLRNWITKEQMYSGGALTGHTREQMDRLFLNRGRTASPTQVWTAWARGVNGPRGVPTDYTDHANAIARSDIRPEYAEMLWGIRYVFPPLFQLSRLVAGGMITPEVAAKWAHYNRYAPEVIAALTTYWKAQGSQAHKDLTQAELADEYEGGFVTETEYREALTHLGIVGHSQDLAVHLGDARRVKRYREKAVDAVAAAFVAFKVDEPTGRAELAALHVTGAASDGLVAVWKLQRRDSITSLTQAQVKKAYTRNMIDKPTALDELTTTHHLTAADADTYLGE